MNKQKIKRFWNDYKVEIIAGAVVVVGVVAGVAICKRIRKSDIKHIAEGQKILDTFKTAATNLPHETHRIVDEDIFTDLAPAIEAAVLEEGLDEAMLQKVYKVAYPKGGDPKNGFYEVKKYVEVLIQDTCE